MFQSPRLQYLIAAIHAKNADDEDDFSQEDQVRVAERPALHLRFPETRHSQQVSSRQKNDGGDKCEYRQNFDQTDDKGVKSSQRGGEKPVCSENAVHKDLDQLYLRDDKCDIYKKVHDGRQPVFEHFLLTESYQQNVAPARAAIAAGFFGPAEANVPPHPAITFPGNPAGSAQQKEEKKSLEHKKVDGSGLTINGGRSLK